MTMIIAKCYRDAHRAAMRQGWTVTRTGDELIWQPPEGPAVVTPSSLSSIPEIKRELARLRKAGLLPGADLPRKNRKGGKGRSIRTVSGGLPGLGKRR